MYRSILLYQANSARKLLHRLSNNARPQVWGDWCNSLFNLMNTVEQSFAKFVLADQTTSAHSPTEPSSRRCVFIIWCFFDEQDSRFWKLSAVRYFNHLTIIFQRFIQAILDSLVVPLEAGLFLFCDACLFLLDASCSLFRFFAFSIFRFDFRGLIVDSKDLIMDKFGNYNSRSFEKRETRTTDLFKNGIRGIHKMSAMAFGQITEVFFLIFLEPFGLLFPAKKGSRRKRWAPKRISRKEDRLEDSLSELRQWDVEIASHHWRTRFKQWLKREFNGTPKTLFVIITFPFWFPWMLVKFRK